MNWKSSNANAKANPVNWSQMIIKRLWLNLAFKPQSVNVSHEPFSEITKSIWYLISYHKIDWVSYVPFSWGTIIQLTFSLSHDKHGVEDEEADFAFKIVKIVPTKR